MALPPPGTPQGTLFRHGSGETSHGHASIREIAQCESKVELIDLGHGDIAYNAAMDECYVVLAVYPDNFDVPATKDAGAVNTGTMKLMHVLWLGVNEFGSPVPGGTDECHMGFESRLDWTWGRDQIMARAATDVTDGGFSSYDEFVSVLRDCADYGDARRPINYVGSDYDRQGNYLYPEGYDSVGMPEN